MKRRMCLPVILALLGGMLSLPLQADDPIEVIELQARSADELIPVLRPLLGPQDSLTGMGGTLVIKAPPSRVRQVRQALATLDRPPRRLLITVGNRTDTLRSSSGYRGSADIRTGNGQISINSPGRPVEDSGARIRLHERSTQQGGTATYRVQALEGRPAYIASGTRVPLQGLERYYAGGVLHEQRTTQLHDVSGGFYVVPRLQGDNVTLEIVQHYDRLARGGVATQRTGTVVSGRLGEWLNLGAIDTGNVTRESGLVSRRSAQNTGARTINVRVDCLDCGTSPQGSAAPVPLPHPPR